MLSRSASYSRTWICRAGMAVRGNLLLTCFQVVLHSLNHLIVLPKSVCAHKPSGILLFCGNSSQGSGLKLQAIGYSRSIAHAGQVASWR